MSCPNNKFSKTTLYVAIALIVALCNASEVKLPYRFINSVKYLKLAIKKEYKPEKVEEYFKKTFDELNKIKSNKIKIYAATKLLELLDNEKAMHGMKYIYDDLALFVNTDEFGKPNVEKALLMLRKYGNIKFIKVNPYADKDNKRTIEFLFSYSSPLTENINILRGYLSKKEAPEEKAIAAFCQSVKRSYKQQLSFILSEEDKKTLIRLFYQVKQVDFKIAVVNSFILSKDYQIVNAMRPLLPDNSGVRSNLLVREIPSNYKGSNSVLNRCDEDELE